MPNPFDASAIDNLRYGCRPEIPAKDPIGTIGKLNNNKHPLQRFGSGKSINKAGVAVTLDGIVIGLADAFDQQAGAVACSIHSCVEIHDCAFSFAADFSRIVASR